MAHCTVTGEIHFVKIPISSEKTHIPQFPEMERLIDLSFYITQKALDHRIGINLDCNMTALGLKHYPIKNYCREGYIPFEILDNPLSNECCSIFMNTWYTSNDARVANVKNTGVMQIQRFFEDILHHESISHITVYFEDIHGIAIETYEYEIEAKVLCETIEKIPNNINNLEYPSVKFIILK